MEDGTSEFTLAVSIWASSLVSVWAPRARDTEILAFLDAQEISGLRTLCQQACVLCLLLISLGKESKVLSSGPLACFAG